MARPNFPARNESFADSSTAIIATEGAGLTALLRQGFGVTQPAVDQFNYIIRNLYQWTQYLETQAGAGSSFTYTHNSSRPIIEIPYFFNLSAEQQEELKNQIEVLLRTNVSLGGDAAGSVDKAITSTGGTAFVITTGRIHTFSGLTINTNKSTQTNNILTQRASSTFFNDPTATSVYEATGQTGINVLTLTGTNAPVSNGYIDNIAIGSTSKNLEGLTLNAGLNNALFNRLFYSQFLGRLSSTIFLIVGRTEAEVNAGNCIVYPLNLGTFRGDPPALADIAIEFQNTSYMFYKRITTLYDAISKTNFKRVTTQDAKASNVVGVDTANYYPIISGRIRKRALGSSSNAANFSISYTSSESPLYGLPVVGSSFYPIISKSGNVLTMRAYATGTQTRRSSDDITLNFFGSTVVDDRYDYSATTIGNTIYFGYVRRPSSGSSSRNTRIATFSKPGTTGGTQPTSTTTTTRTVSSLRTSRTIAGRRDAGMAGNASSGIIFGGDIEASPFIDDNFYSYSVSSGGTVTISSALTKSGDTITGRVGAQMIGSATAGIIFGGFSRSPATDNTDFYSYRVSGGTVTIAELTKSGDTITGRRTMRMVGSTTSGIIFGQRVSDFYSYRVSGSTVTVRSLTNSGTFIAGATNLVGAGMVGNASAGLIFGGGDYQTFYRYSVSSRTITITRIPFALAGNPIPGRNYMGMLGNTSAGLIFGGDDGTYSNDFYSYSISGGRVTTRLLATTGSTITGREKMSMVGTPTSALIFGGYGRSSGADVFYNDFYRYTQTTTTTTTPGTTATRNVTSATTNFGVDGSSPGLFRSDAGESVKLSVGRHGSNDILYVASGDKTAFRRSSSWVSGNNPRFFPNGIRPRYDNYQGNLLQLKHFRTATNFTEGVSGSINLNISPPDQIAANKYSLSGYSVSAPESGRSTIKVTLLKGSNYVEPVASGVTFLKRTYRPSEQAKTSNYEYRHSSYTSTNEPTPVSFGSKVPANNSIGRVFYYPPTYEFPFGTPYTGADRFFVAIPNRYINLAGNPTSISVGASSSAVTLLSPLEAANSVHSNFTRSDNFEWFATPQLGSGNSALRVDDTNLTRYIKVGFSGGAELNLNTAEFRYLLIQNQAGTSTLATLDALNALYNPADPAGSVSFSWPDSSNPTAISATYKFLFQGNVASDQGYSWEIVNRDNYSVRVEGERNYLEFGSGSGVSNGSVLIIRKSQPTEDDAEPSTG